MEHNYKILGVPFGSTVGEIKRSYRQLAKHYHPDNKETGSASKFRLLNDAYNAILDSKPPAQRVEKAAPIVKKKDLERYIGRNRIFRILYDNKDGYTIQYPNKTITEDTVFHFMLEGLVTFDVFMDDELILPQILTVKRQNQNDLMIKIVEGYE